MIVTLAPDMSFVASAWSCALSDALSAELPAAKLRFSAAGFGCFFGTVVVLDVRGVSAKVSIESAPAGSDGPVCSRQHVHSVPVPLQ